jgi:multiple sugar transport system substrate-binding protein
MKEIEFSVMYHNDRASQTIEEIIKSFEVEFKAHVNLRILRWTEAWNELVKVALYKQGPDVSEIGSSWVNDFARMLAFRNYSTSDIRSLGGEDTFLPSSWSSVKQLDQPEIWAVPWLADTRVLYYRRDIFEKAGLDEETAFLSSASLSNSLEWLQSRSIPSPWVVPTHRSRMTLHNSASWVWGAGGSFLSPDGKTTNFTQPEALQGFKEYYELMHFMAPETRDHDDTESDSLYLTGHAATTISGTWLLVDDSGAPEMRANTGFVSPPGIAYVGGSLLSIWRHTHNENLAMDLVRYLNRADVQIAYCQVVGLLPTNMAALSLPIYQSPRYQRLIERLKSGRTFRGLSLWGMIEEKLTAALSQIWSDLLTNPSQDIAQTISLNLQPLGRRLNISLSGQ